MKQILIMMFLLSIVIIGFGQGKEGYYRYPTIHNNTIIFTAEGDLWKISVDGGIAQRLTTHHSMEYNAEFSPDGKTIAYSAQYEGSTDLYTIPVNGGLPKRHTYGASARIIGWTPSSKILYSTRKYSTLPNTQLVEFNLKDKKNILVPLNQASDGAYEPKEETLFFTRLPFQGSYTKRYQGGTVQNIWKFTRETEEAIPLTVDYKGTSKAPMVWKNRVYFATDRDGTMNIWSMDFQGENLKQHTFHSGWDVSNPSLHNGRIVYQRVCDLFLYSIPGNKDEKIDITLASDFDHLRDRWVKNPTDYLTAAHISPEGDKLVFTARGQVFVAPAKQGRFVRVTKNDGIRYRYANFMPDNKEIIVLSDESGEYEFWKFSADGLTKGKALTNNGKVLRYTGVPSPDGKWIAFADKNYQLWLYNTANKTTHLIKTPNVSYTYDLSWSPGSDYLAFVTDAKNNFNIIQVFSITDKKLTQLTGDRVDSYNPEWSPDGNWLYFLSDRHFKSAVRSPWGPRQPEPYFDKTTKIYMIALTHNTDFPFLPDSELVKKKKQKDDSTNKKSIKKSFKRVQFTGIQKRVMELPLPPSNYSNLTINDNCLFWLDSQNGKKDLMALKIGNKNIEPKKLTSLVRNYELTQNGQKLMVRKGKDFFIIKAAATPISNLNKFKVNLDRWTFNINPRNEWRQMFIESWRLERDYFYDPKLHNVDYEGLLKRHLPIVNRVTDRDELNDLIAHLVGEISALHTFVRGGDKRTGKDQVNFGSLGARLIRDQKNNGYRIDYIYQSEPDYFDSLSPLAKPELKIHNGDIITAINGTSTLSVSDTATLLKNTEGQQVLLTIKSSNTNLSRKVIVQPISQRAEYNLRYSDWEYTRRLMVDKLGKNNIGYVHLRAMGGRNYTEWVKSFYPVFNRKGLILDVRHNRGGNIDSWILEKLMRKAWFYWKDRVGKPTWNMQHAFRGHMVIICNERTASDGEAVTEGFRRLGLGKVIGTRTWGGEIWLSGRNYLVDKGIATAAESGVYGPEGKWLIEGWGVEPDIEVDNLPHSTFKGKDAQLEFAVYPFRKRA